MSVAKDIKLGLATIGLTLFTLCSAFNEAVNAAPPDTGLKNKNSINAPVKKTAPFPSSSLKQETEGGVLLFEKIRELDDYYTVLRNHMGRFNPESSPRITEKVQEIIDLVDGGADPNYINPRTGISAFAWGLWLAYELDRPDIVKHFLDHGADPKQVVSSTIPLPATEQSFMKKNNFDELQSVNVSIMDHALRAFIEAQNSYKSHINTAIEIIKHLKNAGASIQDSVRIAGDTRKDLGYLAYNAVSMRALKNAKLIDTKEYELFLQNIQGSQEIDDIAKSTWSLNKYFFELHGGKILEYPDALPGGLEPYTVLWGDTLPSIAQKFQEILGAKSEQEALEAIAAANNIFIDEDNNTIRILEMGDVLLLPVDPKHQIGQRRISPTDTLIGVADRVKDKIGVQTIQEAVRALINANNIKEPEALFGAFIALDNTEAFLADALKPGRTLLYPILGQAGHHGSVTIQPSDTLNGVVISSRHVFYKKNASDEAIAQEITRFNNLNISRTHLDASKLEAGDSLVVPYLKDKPMDFSNLVPPDTFDRSREVNLIIVEPETMHGKQTLRIAANAAFAMNPEIDFSRFFRLDETLFEYPEQDSDALSILLNLDGSSLQDRLVLSHSMGRSLYGEKLDRRRQAIHADNIDFEDILIHLDEVEKNRPIIFDAAGNGFPFSGNYAPSYLLTHSPRTVSVGSAGMYPRIDPANPKMIAPYSNTGADICMSLPYELNAQQEGTSYSTPLLATTYKQFSKWYGDKLSFEEIMAVAYMTADLDVADTSTNKVKAAQYHTNGAGLPHNTRCGAGVVNVIKWNETLKKMTAIKESIDQPGALSSHKILFGKPVTVIHQNNTKEYVYNIKVPRDLTLEKLTFMVAQKVGDRNDVTVKTPAGFSMQLPRGMDNVISTSAFNYEDVREGDVIEVRTNAPFADDAGMILRGHAPGNAIQVMRDDLREQGLLPEPLKTMAGNRILENEGDVPAWGTNIDLGKKPSNETPQPDLTP